MRVLINDILLGYQKDLNVEMILLSEFTGSEIRITSAFRSFGQASRLTGFHFKKPLIKIFSNPV